MTFERDWPCTTCATAVFRGLFFAINADHLSTLIFQFNDDIDLVSTLILFKMTSYEVHFAGFCHVLTLIRL